MRYLTRCGAAAADCPAMTRVAFPGSSICGRKDLGWAPVDAADTADRKSDRTTTANRSPRRSWLLHRAGARSRSITTHQATPYRGGLRLFAIRWIPHQRSGFVLGKLRTMQASRHQERVSDDLVRTTAIRGQLCERRLGSPHRPTTQFSVDILGEE